MGMVGDQWEVTRGDCLWNIAKAVYGDPYMWGDIANENDIPLDRANIIYPGQILDLPGITASAPDPGPPPPPPPPPAYTYTPSIVWFSLRAGTQREMQVIWTQSHNKFEVRWEIWDQTGHLWLESEEFITTSDRQKAAEHTFQESEDRFVCRISIRAVGDNNEALSPWGISEYDFRNNPPLVPPDPEFNINNQNELTVTLNNIPNNINANQIEISIYQDDTLKYNTAKVGIDSETHFAKYVCTVDPGHYYKVRCRAVRGSAISAWTNFTSNDQSRPVAPEEITTLRAQKITDQQNTKYGVFIEWTEEKTAKQYEVQWTTDVQNFDNPSSGGINSQTTEEDAGPRLLIPDIDQGHEFFFRVRSINDKGSSIDFTPIKSIKVGSKPAAPTTWSNVSASILGEDLNLYWAHNSTDGTVESWARLHITVIDSAHPELEPMEYTKQIENDRPEEEKHNNSVYTINTEDPEWSGLLSDGFKIKWKVQTAGITGEFGDWSIEREVNVYTKPTLTLDLVNAAGNSIETVSAFPFYISILAKPQTQKPISYYIEVIANQTYRTVDEIGEVKVVNAGDKVYQKFYDPERNAWRFLVEMTPADIDLRTEINYTLNVTVAMDSGLSCTETIDFNTYFMESRYSVYANVIVDKETLTANINPYCMEYYKDGEETKQRMTDNCTLSVYRREYDGTFTEIASNLENEENVYVMDPHPSLDYARYRVIARSKDTGSISYADIKAVEVGEPAIVIQWSEKWSKFDYDPTNENYTLEVPWSGSMLKLPYNVDISENKNIDVSLIEYVGRKHPVSYYGTQIGEAASWNCEIPADDKETLYGLRRLSRWTGDVYVREPSGTGYWANITVSLSKKHLDVVIPVSFSVKRVEGGM